MLYEVCDLYKYKKEKQNWFRYVFMQEMYVGKF